MNSIYLVEHFKAYGQAADGMRIEDAVTVGFFSNKKKAAQAVEHCIHDGLPADSMRITPIPLRYGNAQDKVFVLLYEYYRQVDDTKEEYYYTFLPRVSMAECERLRAQMAANPDYQPAADKHYYQSADGFRILTYTINQSVPVTLLD